jgi:hypothetical protein
MIQEIVGALQAGKIVALEIEKETRKIHLGRILEDENEVLTVYGKNGLGRLPLTREVVFLKGSLKILNIQAWEAVVLPYGVRSKSWRSGHFVMAENIEGAVDRLLNGKWKDILVQHENSVITDTSGDNVYQLDEVPLSQVREEALI